MGNMPISRRLTNGMPMNSRRGNVRPIDIEPLIDEGQARTGPR